MAASVDLNKLLTYKLDIDFAPLVLHLSENARELALLRAGAGNGPDVGPLLARLAELEARVAGMPPPHMFTWDSERIAIEAAQRAALDAAALAGSAAGKAGEARGEALGASSEASSAAADARKAAAAAAAAALAVPSAPPPRPASPNAPLPVNLDRIETRLEELERGKAAAAGDTAAALRVAREAKEAATAAKEAAAGAVARADAAAAASAARADALEAALAELRRGLAAATESLAGLLAAPPPVPVVAVPEGSSAEAAQLAALRGELGALRAALATLSKKEGETAAAGAATAAALAELAARPPPAIPDIAPLEAAVAALGERATCLEAGAATLAGGLAKVEAGVTSLATRVGGAEQGLAGHSKELRELRGKLELLGSAHHQLEVEVKGLPRGGGSGATEQLLSWASHLTQLTAVLSGHKEEDAPAAPAGAAGDGQLEALGERVKRVLGVARPAASKFEVATLGAAVGTLETRVKSAEATAAAQGAELYATKDILSTTVMPRLPAEGAVEEIASRVGALEAKKVDRDELTAMLDGYKAALAALHARLSEMQKQVAALAAAAKPAEPANAAATGKQLLRDLYCLSCSRSTDYQSTDRGPYLPTNVLTPHVPLRSGGARGGGAEASPEGDYGGHYGGDGAFGDSPAASPSYLPVALGNLSATGAFQVLPNGMVLGKLGLRSATARGGPAGEPTALDSYVRSATSLSAAGAMTQCSPNRPGGMVTHRGPLPPLGGTSVREGDPPPPPTARTASDQGLPATITHRGAGLVAGGVAAATIVASPVVDPKTEAPVPHYYAAPEAKAE
jgi:hypothetical protein